ncbi:MAG: Gfo/Idh/MocA family oxidoreductase [Eubacterium sp.]|nr:Gfo/Idh/MocA family oxidoreductase [Eubacterium sp.]
MKLQYGLVGGGNNGFIGGVHRRAAAFDYLAELKAGAFSRNIDANSAAGAFWGVDPARTYPDYHEMARQEHAREDGIDFVSIATPNFTHYDVAKTFLEQGIHVVCDKPMTLTVEEAEELEQIAVSNDLLFGVSYTYSGYPILLQAKELIAGGSLGTVQMMKARYEEDYLAAWEPEKDDARTAWYKDPEKNGKTGCTAGIGIHAEYLLRFLTGLEPKRLLARFSYTVPESPIETGVNAMLEYENGAEGMIWASNTAVGHRNDVAVEIQCEKGTIFWQQYDASRLTVRRLGYPEEIYDTGRPYLTPAAREACRLPSGHPEGFYEAFSNVYKRFCQDLLAKKAGEKIAACSFPTVHDGLLGMRFIDACYYSHHAGNVWTDI